MTSYLLEPILNYLHRRKQHKSYAHLEWISNNSLQLHRMAHEQLTGKEWAKCAEEIPTTDPKLSLANLDISDPEHPILREGETQKGMAEVAESSTIPADYSSPARGSLHLDSAVNSRARNSTSSSMTTISNWSWTLDVQTAISNVSGQLSAADIEHCDSRRDTMDTVGEQAKSIT